MVLPLAKLSQVALTSPHTIMKANIGFSVESESRDDVVTLLEDYGNLVFFTYDKDKALSVHGSVTTLEVAAPAQILRDFLFAIHPLVHHGSGEVDYLYAGDKEAAQRIY